MQALFEPITTGTIQIQTYLLCFAAALICGLIAAFCAAYRNQSSKSFIISLILLPIIVETVITMVNGNVGTGVAVMGAFSLVRFRSVAGKAKDIVAIFLAMTAGLACAAGYVALAVLFTVCVGIILIVTAHIPMGDDRMADLYITTPETLRFVHEFDDIFKTYTKKFRLVKTKTTNMGSLYKLQYQIEMKQPDQIQDMIDELRCRNGNLEIALAETTEGTDTL